MSSKTNINLLDTNNLQADTISCTGYQGEIINVTNLDTELSTNLMIGGINSTQIDINSDQIVVKGQLDILNDINLSGNLISKSNITLSQISAPANPNDGEGRLYASGSTGIFWKPDSAGAEVQLGVPVTPKVFGTEYQYVENEALQSQASPTVLEAVTLSSYTLNGIYCVGVSYLWSTSADNIISRLSVNSEDQEAIALYENITLGVGQRNPAGGSFIFDFFAGIQNITLKISTPTGTAFVSNARLSLHKVKNFEWLQLANDIDGEDANDEFGYSVSMNSAGDRVAIGSRLAEPLTEGHVRIFEYNGVSWVQLGNKIIGEQSAGGTGISVSLNSVGNRVAIGADLNNNPNGTDAGNCRVFEYNGVSWVQLGFDIDGEAPVDRSGVSVSLNFVGDRVAVGARTNDGNGVDSGHCRIYEYNGATWLQLGADIDGESAGDNAGFSVSLNSTGTRVAVGSPLAANNGTNSGQCRIFEYNGSAWIQLGANIEGDAAGDIFGFYVSMNTVGDRVAIGAPNNDTNANNSGIIKVYEFDGMNWTQLGNSLFGDNSSDGDSRVSLNSAGDILATGAILNDGNGNNSGQVRIYKYDGISTWVQIGMDIFGEAADDQSGHSVSLSSDGTRVAIGARGNDGGGSNSGHCRIYYLSTSTTV